MVKLVTVGCSQTFMLKEIITTSETSAPCNMSDWVLGRGPSTSALVIRSSIVHARETSLPCSALRATISDISIHSLITPYTPLLYLISATMIQRFNSPVGSSSIAGPGWSLAAG